MSETLYKDTQYQNSINYSSYNKDILLIPMVGVVSNVCHGTGLSRVVKVSLYGLSTVWFGTSQQ